MIDGTWTIQWIIRGAVVCGLFVAWGTADALAQAVATAPARSLAGHVDDIHGRPIARALIIASNTSGGAADSTVTDDSGEFRIALHQREDLLTIAATGYATAREMIDERTTTMRVVLRSLSDALAPIRVTASKAMRAEAPGILDPGIAAIDNASSGPAANLASGAFAGNVLGKAELSPGMLLQRSASGQIQGVSVMGLSSDQSSVVVDGVLSSNPRIPRDANVAVRVSTSTYDPSRGGFSGAQVEVTTSPGANISSRYIDLSQSSQLLARSPVGVSDISGTASGALALDHVFYTGSVELSEQRVPSSSFRDRNMSGLADHDVADLSTALSNHAIYPAQIGHVQRTRTGIGLGRLDFVRDTNFSVAVEAHGSVDATEPGVFSKLATAEAFGRSRNTSAGMSASATHHIGNSLHESRIGVGVVSDAVLPYSNSPMLDIRVLQFGTTLGERRSVLAGSVLDHRSSADQVSVTIEHSIRWVPVKEHRLHAGITAHLNSARRAPQANDLGRYTFDSVGAFAAGHASSYTRAFDPVDAKAQTRSLAGYLGDVWTPMKRMSVQIGSRVDVNHVMIPIDAFGSTVTPSVFHDITTHTTTHTTNIDLSPRFGVTVDRPTSSQSPIAGLTFRGGVGRFVNEARPDRFLPASIPVSGVLAASELNCVGDATPPLVLAGDRDGPSTGPTSCLDGAMPSPQQRLGYLLADDWKPASTWRGNVGIAVQTRQQLTLTADFILSRTGRISSIAPLNLAHDAAFVLPLEENRPVFQSLDTVAANAAFATGIPRLRDPSLGRVAELASNLRSRSRQLLVGAQYFTLTGFLLNVQYAWTKSDEEVSMFASSAGGSRGVEWGPSALSPTHVVTVEAFSRIGSRLAGSLTGRLQSGIRYTPVVSGDINGDGLANDRPYIFTPAGASDSALPIGFASLLSSAPRGARECLQRAIGRIIGQNSCVGPWETHLDGQLRMSLGSRSGLQLEVLNITAAADRVIHGANDLHGWGGFGVPDALLYTVTGFDPATRHYRYQANQSFGSSRVTQAVDNPFAIRLSFVFSFARDPSAQQLSIDSARVGHPTYDQLVNRYVSRYPNAALDLLEVADSIALRQPQRDSLRELARTFDATMRTIWSPVARAIKDHPNEIAVQSHRILAARTPAAINYKAYRALIIAVLDQNQLARLPTWPRFDLAENALQVMGLLP